MRISDIRDEQLTEMASFRYYINKVTDDREKDDTEIQYFGQQRAQIPTTTVIAKDGKLTDATTFTVITTRPTAGDRLATQTLMKARQLPVEQQSSFAQSVEGMFLGVWRGLKGGTPYHELEPLLDAYPQVFKVIRNVSKAKLYQMLLTMGMQRYTFEKNYGAAPEEEQAAEHGERLHNAVIFFPDQMRPARKDMIRKFLSTAHDILSKNGMEMLFGGNITFTDLGKRTGGDWQQSTKQMRISPNTKSSTANTYTLLHEYGHKYWWNFMTEEAQHAVREKYNELTRSGVRHKTDWSKLRAVYDAAEGVIEVGTQVEWIGRKGKFAGRWEVTRVNPSFDKRGFKTNSYLAHRLMVNEVDTSGPSIYGPVAALLDKKKWKLLNVAGSDALPDLNDANIEKSDMATDQWFPTNYSTSKATEYWAEMFAFTMLGNLHGEPAEWMNQVLGRSGVTEATVYHGSSHTFRKFNIRKAGTGEGFDAFGYGTYFSEHPDVAKFYSVMGGEPNRNVYTVEIPDDIIDKMLDWDKQLQHQSPYVQECLSSIPEIDPRFGIPREEWFKYMEKGNITGQQVYGGLGLRKKLSKKQVSSLLLKLGIPGIKYLDAVSREDGSEVKTRNIVLFDTRYAKIVNRERIQESRLDELVDVQSPQFQQWFQGSQVVDERGRPQMMFHGTRSNVEFQELRGGSHFGTLGAAGEVTDITGGDRPRTGGARIYPVYLNIKDPVEMWDSKSSHGEMPDQYITDILAQAEFNSDWDLMKKLEAWIAEIEWDSIPDEQKLPNLMDYLSSLGYDGITYENRHEDKGSRSWIPFSKDQVKYAYAESGTVIKNVCKVIEPPPFHGRPTPLTKMQSINELANIDSPEFRQWFGKSKVVHPQYGKPMMVFHGTRSDKGFGKLRAFSHFGTHLASQKFTEPHPPGYRPLKGSGARVFPVYLRIENPAPMIDSGEQHDAEEIAQGLQAGLFADGWSDRSSRLRMLINSWLGKRLKEHQKLLQVIKFLQKQGFDGIAYENIEEDPGSMSWIPFNQSQIKYAYAESRVDELIDVQNPKFQQWFQGSQVVDGQGRPKIMFHGTASTKHFEKLRGVSHFGSLDAASDRLKYTKPGPLTRQDAGSRIYPVYLNIKNPVEMHDSGSPHSAYIMAMDLLSPLRRQTGNALAQTLGAWTRAWKAEAFRFGLEHMELNAGYTWKGEAQRMKNLVELLKKHGYDGIFYVNQEEDAGSTSWITFSPKQIKYAYAESITEGVDLLPQKIYHGTVGTDKAEKILQQGVRAQRIMNPKTHLAPVAGRVYAAQNLGYAMMYAMGGAMAGFEMPNVPEEDPYGYLFVIDKSEVLDDILPDEDNVGEAWMYAEMVNNGKLDTLKEFYFEDPVARAIASDEAFRNQVYYLGTNVASERTLKFVKGGEYMWFAKLGKMMLKQMGPKMKELFLSAGGNVSVQGPLTPSEVWRLDRRRTKELQKDGSNFFQVAERIR